MEKENVGIIRLKRVSVSMTSRGEMAQWLNGNLVR